jgi:mannitol operon repressor
MNVVDSEDLGRFLAELRRETDRGLPLVAAALVDEKLRDTLHAFFCTGKAAERLLSVPYAPLGTLSARIEACFALGLIDEFEYREISIIRKVRNAFAHSKHGISFEEARVRTLCASLQADLPQGEGYPIDEPRFRFINSTVWMVIRLYYRAAWVERERRQPKTWVEPEATRWRSIKDELPQSDSPVLVIGRQRRPE